MSGKDNENRWDNKSYINLISLNVCTELDWVKSGHHYNWGTLRERIV